MPRIIQQNEKCSHFRRRKGLWLEDEIPDCLLTRWRAWLYDLLKISQVASERCVKPVESSDDASCQIHHFCDASQEACRPLLGQVYFLFFIGKSCLAPFFKETTIPTSELTADTVSARLKKSWRRSYSYRSIESPFARTVWQWYATLRMSRSVFAMYVANRIAVRI